MLPDFKVEIDSLVIYFVCFVKSIPWKVYSQIPVSRPKNTNI